jgi:pimeloyl-ACP methyl ester carboxylesterase
MTTLLLSGWMQPVDALAHLEAGATLFDYSAHGNADAAMEQMARINPSRVIGWSMGGQLALRAIMAGAITPKHLTLIAAPIQFVSDAKVKGMDPITFRQFRENYATDPARTKTRLHGLVAKGDRDMKRVMGQLSHHPKVEDVAHWLPWLDDLGAQRLGSTALASAPPTLIIHGMSDAIVPFTQSEHLARMLPRAQVNAWPEVGHAPHVHDSARLMTEIAAHRAEHGVQ